MGNISQKKRKKMLEFLNELKSKHQDDNSLRAIGEIETALNEKKYGLVWEKHTERVDEMLEHNIPIFCEDESRKIIANENEAYNFLLEGDNLHSLTLLEKTHKGKIDVIYIDPPYNTGNKDFIYNDSFVDKTDGYSHSKWLSFMSERLKIARELLSDEGVIFISIDDNEQAQLKLLCDEIFGEENFVSNICVETSSGLFGVKAKHANKGIVKTKDYVLVYCKSTENLCINPLYTSSKTNFDTHFTIYKDEKNEIPLTEYIRNNDFLVSKFNKVDLSPSVANLNKLMSVFTDVEEYIINISDKIFRLREYTLKITEEIKSLLEVSDIILNDFILRKTGDGEIVQLYPFSRLIKQSDDYNSKKSRCVILGDFWKGFNEDMGNIGKEGNIKFSNGKKPLRLIKNLIKLSIYKNASILDFFAGSGTTGHAVMQLNKEDGGNRKYILCTNNENNICEEVTYQRLKNIQEELPHNLKYFKTDFIPKYNQDEDEKAISEKMLDHIKELIELEHHIEIDNKKYIILEDEEQVEEAIERIEEAGKLFISSGIFLSRTAQRKLYEKNVSIVDIPEYYYRIELKEIGEL